MNSNPSWALFWPTEWLAYMFCSLSIFKNLWYCISYRKTKETIFPKLLRGSLCMWWKVCLLCLFLAATILNWHLVLIVFILFCYFLLFFFLPEQEFPRQGKCRMYACQKLVQLLKQTLPLVQGILLFMRRLEKTSLVSCDESQCQFVWDFPRC